jgi:hypothetical protein
MRALDRARIWATPVLLLVVLALAAAFAVKIGFISRSKLVANKDWLSVGSAILSAAAILITALLAYFRFFRGRTFARRAVLTVDVTVLNAPYGGSLHTIVVHVNNVGTIPIWNPRIAIEVTEIDTAGGKWSSALEASYELAGASSSDRSLINVLDSDETTDFVAQTMINRKVWAVTYLVTLRSSSGDAWSTVRAVEAQGIPYLQLGGINRLSQRRHRPVG